MHSHESICRLASGAGGGALGTPKHETQGCRTSSHAHIGKSEQNCHLIAPMGGHGGK